jgi:hypothetical protein
METFECASVTLAACRSVLGRPSATVLERLIAFTGREP